MRIKKDDSMFLYEASASHCSLYVQSERSTQEKIPFHGLLKLVLGPILFLFLSPSLHAQTVVEYGSFVTGGGGLFGNDVDDTFGMFEDATGIYYVGILDGPGMQTTPGAYQPNHGGDKDLAMIKVDHTGQVVWSTYLGGPSEDGEIEPYWLTDKSFLVEGDALYVVFHSADPGMLPGFNYVGTPTENALHIAKMNAITGNLEWGTGIYTYDNDIIDPRDIVVDNDKIYIIGDDYGPGTAFTTPDALESTGPGGLYLSILDGVTGAVDYATYYTGGSDYAQSGKIAVAGNILAITGFTYELTPTQRNTTADAYSSVGSTSQDNGFISYFDIGTRQIVYDSYVTNGSNDVQFDMSLDLQTDGTRFYYLSYLRGNGGQNFVVNPPYTHPSTPTNVENPWMQIWNLDGTLESSFDVLTVEDARNQFFPWPYLTLDAANNRYFIHGYAEEANFPPVNSIVDHTPGAGEDGSFVLEFEMSSNTLLFSQLYFDAYYLQDVDLDADGNLYMIMDNYGGSQLGQYVTPDALFTTSPSGNSNALFVKLDANRDLVYGTYLGNNFYGDSRSNRVAQVNILEDGEFEIFGYSFNRVTESYTVLTSDAQFIGDENDDYFYLRLNCCPDGTENTISELQEVCIEGLAQVIEGSQIGIVPYDDFTFNGGLVAQDQNVPWDYQWQASFNNVDWADVPGAINRDFLPAPTSVDVFFRRLAKPQASICTPDTSNVHILTVNDDQAPSLEAGLSLTCPGVPVVIGTPATGGAGGGNYVYEWTPDTELDDATLAQPTSDGILGGIYVVTVTDTDNGCQFAENWEVQVVTADAGEDKVKCIGDEEAVVIGLPSSADDGLSYSWDVLPGGDDITSLNNPLVAQPLASPNVTTTYELTTTVVATGCSTTSTMTVGVGDPVATAGPDLVLCLGDDAVLGGETDQSEFTYGWAPGLYIDNQNVAQPNFMSSLCPTDDPFLATGNPLVYTVTKIDNASGCVDIDTVEIVLLQIDLYNEKFCTPALIGDRQAECGLTLPGVTFNWTVLSGDAASIVGQENEEFPTVDPSMTTLYQLQVFYEGVGYCTDTVRVSPDCVLGCNIDIAATSDINCPVGGDFNTSIAVTGSVEGADINSLPPGYTFEWVPTTGLANPTSTTTSVGTLAADQTYVFNVRNALGDIICTESIDVFATAAANPIVGIPPSVEGCLDAEITIGLPEVDGWAYVWSPADDLSDADGNPGANEAQPTVTVTQDREYIVVATDIVTGCEYRDTVEVLLVEPIANAGPDVTFCENAIVTLGSPAIPNYSYSWTPSLGLSEPNVAQPTDTIFDSVTYFLEVTDNTTGCMAFDTVTFTLSSPPVYDAPDITICENSGTMIGLPAQPGFSYFWSPAAGLSDPNAAQPVANPSSTTTYSVVVSDGNAGCYTGDQVTVTVVPTSFTLELTDIMDCVGTVVNIGVADQGGSYSWSPTMGLSDPAISNPTVTVSDTEQTYILSWDTPDGCTLVDTVVIMPFPSGVIDFVMAYEICEGESVVIGDDAEDATATYSWSVVLGDDISSLSDASIYNPTATPDQTTVYELAFTSSDGCIQTKRVTVSVVPLPPAVDLGPDITSCMDEELSIPAIGDLGGADYTESFEVDLGGWTQNTDDDFNWTRDSGGTPTSRTGPTTGSNGTVFYLFTEVTGPANGASAIITSPAIPLDATATTMSFDYHLYQFYSSNNSSLQLEISNDGGVNWYQLWSETGDQGNQWRKALIDVSAFAGSTVNLRFTGTKGTNTIAFQNDRGDMAIDEIRFSGNTVPEILWSTGATTNTITVSPSGSPVTYSVTVSYGACTTTDEIVISAPFAIDAGENQNFCAGSEPVIIGTPDASGGALTYSWSIAAGPGPLPTIINTPEIAVSPTGTTTYLLTVEDDMGCIITDEVRIFGLSGDVFDLGPDQTICTGGCVDIGLVFDEDFSYNWTPTLGIQGSATQSMITVCPTMDMQYVLEITDRFLGCRYLDTIEIFVLPDVLDAADAGMNAVICEGEEVTIGTPDASGGTVNYNWTIASGPGPLPAVTNTAQIMVTPTGTTTYMLDIDNGGICMDSDEVRVTVLATPPPVDLGVDQTVCMGGCITIGIPSEAGVSYEWLPTTGITDPTQSQVTICPTEDINYILIATNDATLCSLSDDITLTIGPDQSPAVDAGEDVSICPGETVQIGSPTMPNLIYQWSPTTNLANTTLGNPTFVGNTPGDYTYFLTVVDQVTNCISMTDTVVVTVDPALSVIVSTTGAFCNGGVLQVNASVAGAESTDLAYSWSPAAIFEDATVQNPIIVNMTEDTPITLSVTNTVTGCVASGSTVAMVSDETLELDLGPDLEVCLNELVNLGITSLTSSTGSSIGGEIYAEGFESGLGGWTQSAADNFDWTRNSGPTPTNFTGPTAAIEGSFYLYAEMNDATPSQAAIIESPTINLPASATTMSFEYHMWGLNFAIGNLTLEISDDAGANWNILWSTSVSAGINWVRHMEDVSLYAGGPINIRFTGTRGASTSTFGERGDMAIDDIRFSANTLSSSYVWTSADQGSTVFTDDATYFNGGQSTSAPSINTSSEDFDRTYQLIVSDAITGCSATDEVDVTVNGPPAIIDAGIDAFVCGDTYTMTATPPGVSPIVGTWSQVSGPTTATFSDVNDPAAMVSNLSLGTYQFEWTIIGSCEDGSDFVTIEVVDPPVLVVNAITGLCGADRADLTAAAVTAGSTLNGASLSYWLDAAATVPVPDATMVQAGTYYIRAFNGSTSCEVTEAISIQIPQCVAVGNLVFMDNNNNGTFDSGTDMGISGVTVQLFKPGDDPATATPVGTTITDGSGYYYFDGLVPGMYFIHIPASNFADSQPLDNKFSYPGADGTSTVDGNDNGIDAATPAVDGVSSNTFTLTPNGMPTGEDQTNYPGALDDNNVNSTIDFSFRNILDYGDLPDVYSTLMGSDGPGHLIVPDLQIGATIDNETDGQPLVGADGDDTNGDDEDGVDFTNVPFSAGNTVNIPVVVTNTTGSDATLYAFIDWNNDGDFGDTGETVEVTVASAAGAQTILVPFTIPSEADGTAINITTGARFRLTTDDLATTNPSLELWEGLATDGEIEDYIIMISCPTGNCFGVEINTTNN